jgi:hypothetical protein
MGRSVLETDMDMTTQNLIVAGIVALIVIVIAAGAWLVYRQQQTLRLQQRFGAEYAEVVRSMGSKAKAEAELRKREKRVERLEIVPLTQAEVNRFAQSWTRLQSSFVDDPKGVLIEADQLVRDLMLKRGYPMADFERRAADVSVDHPGVVSNYRAAQQILSRDQRGEADTEDLRKAVVHFRALFDELLGTAPATDQLRPETKLAA